MRFDRALGFSNRDLAMDHHNVSRPARAHCKGGSIRGSHVRSYGTWDLGNSGDSHNLDLSVHLPRVAASESGEYQSPTPMLILAENRFEVLAVDQELRIPSREHRHPSRYRRHRRINKESNGQSAPRRRHGTRSSRKRALLQTMDDQLSRDIDFVLPPGDVFPRHTGAVAKHCTPIKPIAAPVTSPQVPNPSLASPRLDELRLQHFELDSFRGLLQGSPRSVPSLTPPILQSGLFLPSLRITPQHPRRKSSLSICSMAQDEGTQTEASVCRDLQVWQPPPQYAARSAPSLCSSYKPLVAPPVRPLASSCKPFPSKDTLEHLALIVDWLRRMGEEAAQVTDVPIGKLPKDDIVCKDDSTPANLWTILAQKTPNATINDPSVSSFEPLLCQETTHLQHDHHAPPQGPFELDDREASLLLQHHHHTRPQGPSELEGREVPYVHANSLTGLANELALSPYADEHPATLADSAIYFSEPPQSLNELMMEDAYTHGRESTIIHTVDDTFQPASSYDVASLAMTIADLLPINCVRTPVLENQEVDFTASEACNVPLPKAVGSEEDLIDLASFLAMDLGPEIVLKEEQDKSEHDFVDVSAVFLDYDVSCCEDEQSLLRTTGVENEVDGWICWPVLGADVLGDIEDVWDDVTVTGGSVVCTPRGEGDWDWNWEWDEREPVVLAVARLRNT